MKVWEVPKISIDKRPLLYKSGPRKLKEVIAFSNMKRPMQRVKENEETRKYVPKNKQNLQKQTLMKQIYNVVT